MSFYGSQQGPTEFLTTIAQLIYAMLGEHGLAIATDVTSPTSMGPFGLLSELEAPGESYDDRPAIEKLIASISTAAKKMKEAQDSSTRIIGAHPLEAGALILIGLSFTSVPSEEAAELDSLGEWAISIRCGAVRKQFEGNVFDHSELRKALLQVKLLCSELQGTYNLQPVPKRQPYGDIGPFIGAVPGAVDG